MFQGLIVNKFVDTANEIYIYTSKKYMQYIKALLGIVSKLYITLKINQIDN